MQDISEFERSVSGALADAGCNSLSVEDLRVATRQCRDEIYADTVNHGGNIAAPFVNFVIVSGVGVFTFFETEFSIYVVACDESELLAETNVLAMVDVEEHRKLLSNSYRKSAPDAVIQRDLAELWLG